jgi:hypothetical protein
MYHEDESKRATLQEVLAQKWVTKDEVPSEEEIKREVEAMAKI